MTERKPFGVSFETWVDRQIRVAQERGDFDDLPGAGKPLPQPDDPNDELWWVRSYVEREGLPADALLPTPLRLRREIERVPETVREFSSEDSVRDLVEDLNYRIVDWVRTPSGPRLPIAPLNVDQVVQQWRTGRAARASKTVVDDSFDGTSDRTPDTASPTRTRWWQRLTRRHSR